MSGKQIFINELQEGQRIDELFLVAGSKRLETKAGKPYLIVTLMDRSGEIGGRLWENVDRYESEAEVGSVAVLRGSAQSFRDELQLKIDSVNKLQEDDPRVDLADYLPTSKRPVEQMLLELQDIIDSLTDHDLRQLLQEIFQGETLAAFKAAPAAKKMHHAYLGGLLEHTLSVTTLAGRIADQYQSVDRDLFLSGALLHDLGKIKEFSFHSVPFDYTDSGRLLGHAMLGSEIVREAAGRVAKLSAHRLDQVLHLILSHHGRHEFGAPVVPMTIEALLLHHVDDIDAKVNYIDKLSENVGDDENQWSDYQRPLERFLLLHGSPEEKPKTEQPAGKESRAVPGKKKEKKRDKAKTGDDSLKQQTLF